MHIHILDGSQGMCSNAPSDDAAAGSMAVSSTPAGRVSNSHDQPFKSRVNSSRIDTVTTGSGTSSTLASWLAPSTSTSTGEPSKRATSIPDPAGASAPSAFQEDVDNDQEDGYTDAGNTRRPSLPSSSRHQPSSSTLSALLEPFTPSNRDQTSGRIKIPPTSRAGADIAEQKTASGVGLLESWKYLPFLAHQGQFLLGIVCFVFLVSEVTGRSAGNGCETFGKTFTDSRSFGFVYFCFTTLLLLLSRTRPHKIWLAGK